VSWSEVYLGVIAAATLVMALIQVGAIVALARVARQIQGTLTSVQSDVRPLLAKVTALTDEASKTAVIATAQAEKIDRIVTDLAHRIDETSAIVQQAIVTPAREGLAIFAAVRATLGALRGFPDLRSRQGRHAEDEDPLFIG
jgi:hypothetical protein